MTTVTLPMHVRWGVNNYCNCSHVSGLNIHLHLYKMHQYRVWILLFLTLFALSHVAASRSIPRREEWQ